MKINLSEREIAKKMMLIINEDTSSTDEEELSPAELSEEQEAFRSTVSPRVEFTGFKVYPKNKNVVFSGKFQNMDGLEWQLTLEDADGLYITANSVQITDDSIGILKKLKGFYDNWADEWAKKLATEYNRNSDDDEAEVQQSESV
jgi:hypothetical protein